jgi:hypothetical protein
LILNRRWPRGVHCGSCIPVRTVVAILTALLLLASQTGVWSASAITAAQPCCGTCAGACCVKACDGPVSPQPLAPVTASPAPVLKLVLPPLLECGESPAAEFLPSFAPPRWLAASPPLPLFLRHCVLLI